MKPENLSWDEYLKLGIAHMEGTTPEGQRDFTKAERIFEDCFYVRAEENVPLLPIEAAFRWAQLAHYRRDFEKARWYADFGLKLKKESPVGIPAHLEAFCFLIEGIVLEDESRRHDAFGACIKAGEKAQLTEGGRLDHKLLGDIANWKARLLAQDVGDRALACREIMEAVRHFKNAHTPDSSVYHARAAASARAAMFCQQYSWQMWREANRLHTTGKVRDACLRARYWKDRCALAWKAIQPLRALWFGFRAIWPSIRCWKVLRK